MFIVTSLIIVHYSRYF